MPSFTSLIYALNPSVICGPISAKRFTNFGVKSLNMPSISAYTSTCPSQPFPAPIPMVGISNFSVTSVASFSGTHSSTTANAPASCTASASSISFCAAASVFPCTLNPPNALIDCGVSPICAHTGIPCFNMWCYFHTTL